MNRIEITDILDPRLDIYGRLSERALYHLNEPKQGIFIAESPRVIEIALNQHYQPCSILIDKNRIDAASQAIIDRCGDIEVFAGEESVLAQLTGFHLTKGMLCSFKRRELPSVKELCQDAHRIVILEGVVNPTNIGAIIRSAAALSFDAVLLTPDCADPLYRRAARVSMGTVFQVPWTYLKDYRQDLEELRHMGFKTVATALRNDTIDLTDPCLQKEDKLAVIFGTEGDGLCEKTIAECDYTVTIPMKNGVDSLNVAAASAVIFWQLRHAAR